jgi:hypothetical protein
MFDSAWQRENMKLIVIEYLRTVPLDIHFLEYGNTSNVLSGFIGQRATLPLHPPAAQSACQTSE